MSRRVPRSRTGSAVETATRRAMAARDAGLRRIAAVTRWTAVAVVALSGALALIAAKAFHGHTVASTPPAASSTQTQTPPAATQTTPTPAVQQPEQAPAPAPVQQPVVVSGGS